MLEAEEHKSSPVAERLRVAEGREHKRGRLRALRRHVCPSWTTLASEMDTLANIK